MSVNKILNYYILTHLLFILHVKGVMVRCNIVFRPRYFLYMGGGEVVVSQASANFSEFPGEFVPYTDFLEKKLLLCICYSN